MPDGGTLQQRIGVEEFQDDLPGFLRKVGEGASFLITSGERVLAEVRPASEPEQRPRRQPGGLRGKIWMAPDFDEWPPGFLDAMEGKDDPDEFNLATKAKS